MRCSHGTTKADRPALASRQPECDGLSSVTRFCETMITAPSSRSSVWEYQSLYRYLENRFADTVVLTFAQVEALLGFTLPDLARLRLDWWASPEAGAVPSSQSRSWIDASRTAMPNLRAQNVKFERVSK
jgi:hypothetical protein